MNIPPPAHPLFVALTGIEAQDEGRSAKVTMKERYGSPMTFEVTSDAADQLIGALRLEIGRNLKTHSGQLQFIAVAASVGAATGPDGKTSPALALSLEGGGTVFFVIPQLLFEELGKQFSVSAQPGASYHA